MKGFFPKKVNVWILLTCVLAILLIAGVVYVCAVKYKEARTTEKIAILQAGIQAGYEQAVLQLMDEAAKCRPFSVHSGNESMQLIDVSCLNASSNSSK